MAEAWFRARVNAFQTSMDAWRALPETANNWGEQAVGLRERVMVLADELEDSFQNGEITVDQRDNLLNGLKIAWTGSFNGVLPIENNLEDPGNNMPASPIGGRRKKSRKSKKSRKAKKSRKGKGRR